MDVGWILGGELAKSRQKESIPVVIPEAGGEDVRPPTEPIGGGDRHTPAHSSAGTHITAVWQEAKRGFDYKNDCPQNGYSRTA